MQASRRLLVLLAASLPGALVAQVSHFSARLTGDQQNPPVASSASGWGVVALDDRTNQVRIFVETTGLSGTVAHLHLGGSGQNGSPIVALTGGPARWSGSGTLDAAQVAALKSAGTYLNVHTTANPGGEIRGQAAVAHAMRFTATMDGGQEVPPNSSTAAGEAVAYLHEPDNVLVYEVKTTGLVNVTAAHVHIAPRGQNGGVLFPLNGANGQYCGVSRRLTPAEMQALRQEGLYFNVHTQGFPGGEIRGQIVAPAGGASSFYGQLAGSNEVPPVGTSAQGEACVELTVDGRLRYRVTTTGLSGTAAHIHRAPQLQNGPVLFPLTGGPTVWAGTTAPLTSAQLADLLAGNYYVNVHTQANPGGEIRDQLREAGLPTTYGGACRSGNGQFSEIGAIGAACLGADFGITLQGAMPSRAAVLLLGASRDSMASLPLPLPLAGVGSPDCFLLTSFGDVPLLSAPTDGFGCARFPLAIPFATGLRGQRLYGQWIVVEGLARLVASNGLEFTVR